MTGKESVAPLSSAQTTLAGNIFSRQWQVGGVFQATVQAAIPSLAANATTTVAVPLIQLTKNNDTSQASPFPFKIALGNGQLAVVTASVSLLPATGVSVPISAVPFFGMPYVQLVFSSGSPAVYGGTGSAFSLAGPGTFLYPALKITLPVYGTAAGSSAFTAFLAVSATLLGLST